jgi:hypothetical protein
MYRHHRVNQMTMKAKRVVGELFDLHLEQPQCLPAEWQTQVAGSDEAAAARLVADLDREDFRARDKATAALERLGQSAAGALRKALDGQASVEGRRRLEHLLQKLEAEKASPEYRRIPRAIEALEQAGTPEARQVLEVLARGAREAQRTQEAYAALKRFAGRTD